VSNLEFGITLTVVGMGATMLILLLISLAVDALIKILPRSEKEGGDK
jgi:Na+-transporting methylmalonyl-CoA/oxaloacetate decarboxylase gamma subunit